MFLRHVLSRTIRIRGQSIPNFDLMPTSSIIGASSCIVIVNYNLPREMKIKNIFPPRQNMLSSIYYNSCGKYSAMS